MLTEEAVTTEAKGFFQGLKFVIEKADHLQQQRLGCYSTLLVWSLNPGLVW